MTTTTATLIRECFDARDRWESHFDGCRTCGPRLCAEGSRLHTTYATIKTRIERGR